MLILSILIRGIMYQYQVIREIDRKVKKKVTLLSSTCLISRQFICGFDSFSSLQTIEIFKVSDWSGMPRTREKGCTTIPVGREKQIADENWRSSVISANFYS